MLNRRNTKASVSDGKPVAIEPGAAHTRIFSAGKESLITQPSIGVIDMDHRVGGIASVGPFGIRAQESLDTAASSLKLIQPLQADKLNELGFTEKMLSYFIDHGKSVGVIGNTTAIKLVLPHNIKQQKADQLRQACLSAGVSRVQLTDGALSAFYAMDVDHSQSHILIDFGAAETRVIAIANGKIVNYATVLCSGDTLDHAMYCGLLSEFGLEVSTQEARRIKHCAGAATPPLAFNDTSQSIQVTGLSVTSNQTTEITISPDTVFEILRPELKIMSRSINRAYSEISDSLKDAAYDNGLKLFGGGAKLARIDQLVMAATGSSVGILPQPASCAVRGAARGAVRGAGSQPATTQTAATA